MTVPFFLYFQFGPMVKAKWTWILPINLNALTKANNYQFSVESNTSAKWTIEEVQKYQLGKSIKYYFGQRWDLKRLGGRFLCASIKNIYFNL